VLDENLCERAVEVVDALVELFDLARELSNATRASALRETVAELDAFEFAQLVLAVAFEERLSRSS
jgi:hypothetical protein